MPGYTSQCQVRSQLSIVLYTNLQWIPISNTSDQICQPWVYSLWDPNEQHEAKQYNSLRQPVHSPLFCAVVSLACFHFPSSGNTEISYTSIFSLLCSSPSYSLSLVYSFPISIFLLKRSFKKWEENASIQSVISYQKTPQVHFLNKNRNKIYP